MPDKNVKSSVKNVTSEIPEIPKDFPVDNPTTIISVIDSDVSILILSYLSNYKY